ncbi:hypothetical protein D623_10031746 [Myotis brandtii]|uniref:Uncharacterized protein n=1 Tax=Myotis brandtii TaxID=109478 RepID=S7N396_MYOBR|nr:hypothetical protein D623_10031746 [Myotis brandtii]
MQIEPKTRTTWSNKILQVAAFYGVAGREQLLAQQRMHSMLSSGKSLSPH